MNYCEEDKSRKYLLEICIDVSEFPHVFSSDRILMGVSIYIDLKIRKM